MDGGAKQQSGVSLIQIRDEFEPRWSSEDGEKEVDLPCVLDREPSGP